MPSLSIKELIKIAYIRNEESVSYFKSQAFKCNDKINRSFLLFLTGKKREEQILLEKVALKNNINVNKFKKSMQGPNRLLINQSNFLYLKTLKEIYDFSYQYAIDEYEFYLRIDSFIKDEKARYAFNVLYDFSQDFVFDVRSGYIEFQSKYNGKPPVKELHLLGENQRKDLVYN